MNRRIAASILVCGLGVLSGCSSPAGKLFHTSPEKKFTAYRDPFLDLESPDSHVDRTSGSAGDPFQSPAHRTAAQQTAVPKSGSPADGDDPFLTDGGSTTHFSGETTSSEPEFSEPVEPRSQWKPTSSSPVSGFD